MQCKYCGRILTQPLGRGRRRLFCNAACKMRHARGTAAPRRPPLPDVPAWHHGRFEDYAAAYAGQIHIILTDPPYGRKHVPIYEALARFAVTVLAPKGFLLCMCGHEELREVLNIFANTPPLIALDPITYLLRGNTAQGRRPATTQHVWRRHYKWVLWYQQPGPPTIRRRSGATNVIEVPDLKGENRDHNRFKWEQSLLGFEKLVDGWTENGDVICDPMMGAGTTLLAAWNRQRYRVIGIEQHATTYAIADARLREAGLDHGQLPAPPRAS